LKFVAIEVISPPLTSRSLSNITLPVPTWSAPEGVTLLIPNLPVTL
jgi:hypothetical protein